MEQADIGKNDNTTSNMINRKRGVENLATYVTANKKALLSKDENTRQLEQYIPDLKRVEHQTIIKSSNKHDLYKIKNTPKYESRFIIDTPQKWIGDNVLVEIGTRLEDKNGVLLTENSRNELCPTKLMFEYLIKKIEIRYKGDINIINHSPLTRARVIEQHMKMFSLASEQMKIQADIFGYHPEYVGDGITAVAEKTITSTPDLSPAQKYYYELAKKFHKNIDSDGYVYYWVPFCMLSDFFNGKYPRDTTNAPLELKILENSNLTTKNLFIKYQKADSTHFSNGDAVGSTDKINIDDIVCHIKIDRVRIESVEYSNIFNTVLDKYNTEHMNEGITIYEGPVLDHKEISIGTNSRDTDFFNIEVSNYENSNFLILNLFKSDFPFKNTLNAEAYRTDILKLVKKIEVKYYDVGDNTNREITYDIDNRDDRFQLFKNFKACLVGNDDATTSPMGKFNNSVSGYVPKLNNFSYNTYWKSDGTNYTNNECPIVINLDTAKRTIMNALPPVKIQGMYQLKLRFRAVPTSRLNLIISRDYIGGYKVIRKSIKDDPEIVYYPSPMKGV